MGGMKLQFIIDAKDKSSAAFKKVQGNMNNLQKGLKSHQALFKKMALAGTVAFAAIGAGVWKATQSAVKAQEIFNKFDTVFDDVGNKAEEVAQDLRDNWGLAESTAKDLLSATGDLLSGFGFTGEAALELSKKTQQMAIDLASFTNLEGGAARASEILTKAMLGEKDSLIALGIKILDADVEARLLAEGKDNLTGTALRQAKAEITLQLAIEQSGKAMGDYARTSTSAANQQRLLKERTKELSEKLGTVFVPILEAIIQKVVPIVERIAEWSEQNPELARVIIIATIAVAGLVAILGTVGIILPAIITLFGILTGVALPWIAALMVIIGTLTLLSMVVWKLYKDWDLIVKGYKIMFEEWKEKIIGVLTSIKQFFVDTWEGIKIIVSDVIDALMIKIQPFIDAFEKVKGGAMWLGEKAGEVTSWAKEKLLGGGQFGIPYVPQTGAYLLHKGETVIPAGAGIGEITINIMGGNYLSEDAAEMFGEKIANELKRNQRL